MCKQILIPNASLIPDFPQFTRDAAEWLKDQSDGYGFVAQGKAGMFGARTLSPSMFAANTVLPTFCKVPHESFGEISDVVGGAMFHGRISTNKVSLNNTHPISRHGAYVVHNGVVTHHGEKYAKLTTNDSEDVLHEFLTTGIGGVASNLTGYYAAGILTPDGLMHVFRDAIAPLVYAWSDAIQSPIFASNQYLLNCIGDYLNEDLIGVDMKDNCYLIFKDGELLSQESFVSRGWDMYAASLSHLSLGRTLDEKEAWGEYDDSPYDKDISEDYLDEQPYFDHSYTFFLGMREIGLEEYEALDFSEQLMCTVKRCDGTTVEPFEMESEAS